MQGVVIRMLAGLLGLTVAASVRADDQAQARGVVDQATKAMGPEEKLSRLKATTWKAKGTFYGFGNGAPFTSAWAVLPPHRSRRSSESGTGNRKFTIVIVVDDQKGWIKQGDALREMDKERLKAEEVQGYLFWVRTLTPLKGRDFKLMPLGESKIGAQTVVGVKVEHKGRPDVQLFFDKQSGLLLKDTTRVINFLNGKEADQVELFSDYKDYEGVKHPTKLIVKLDGKLLLESELSDFKDRDKLEESAFAKP